MTLGTLAYNSCWDAIHLEFSECGLFFLSINWNMMLSIVRASHLSATFSINTSQCAQLLQSCPTLWDPETVVHKAPLSMGFPRQEYWSGLPCPIPGNLPDSGIEPTSPAVQVDSLPTEPPGKPIKIRNLYKKLSHIPQHAGEIIFILWGQGGWARLTHS